MNKKVIRFTNGDQKPARFWNIASSGEESATIELYGDVVSEQPRDWWTGEAIEGQFITPEGFAEDLEQIKDKAVINIKINSLGGDVYTGIAIHNALKALKGHKNVVVEGIAASAASVIAMAGDKIQMFPGSLMMIHNVSGLLYDWFNLTDLKKIARSFDAIEKALAAIYSVKTGLDQTVLRSMMDRETWFTGAEAVEKGFADELLDENPAFAVAYNASAHLMVVNGVKHNTYGLNIPDRLNLKPLAASATVDDKLTPPKNKGEKQMTKDELRAQYPGIVAEIEAEAVAADRARIQEIEEIQNTIGDDALVNEAKFVKPTNAAALALAAMKKNAALGASFIKARAEEQEGAGEVKAVAAQQENIETLKKAEKAGEAEAIKNLANQFKNVFGG